MILQTSESIFLKTENARMRLGKYLMVGIIFRHGFIFGKTYHRRLHIPLQWAWLSSPWIAAAIIGDLGNLKTVKAYVRNVERDIDQHIGNRYVTAAALAKSAHNLFLQSHKEPDALAVEMSIADVRENRFWLVDINGDMKHFSDFIIAGCQSVNELVPFEKLSSEEQTLIRAVQKKTSTEAIAYSAFIRKPAIAFLEAKLKEKAFSSFSRSEASALVCETLTRFEPPSRHDQIELAIYESKGKRRFPEALESIIVDRDPRSVIP